MNSRTVEMNKQQKQDTKAALNELSKTFDQAIVNPSNWDNESQQAFAKNVLGDVLDNLQVGEEFNHDDENFGYDNLEIRDEKFDNNPQEYIDYLKLLNNKNALVEPIKQAYKESVQYINNPHFHDYYAPNIGNRKPESLDYVEGNVFWSYYSISSMPNVLYGIEDNVGYHHTDKERYLEADKIAQETFLKSLQNAKWYVQREKMEQENSENEKELAPASYTELNKLHQLEDKMDPHEVAHLDAEFVKTQKWSIDNVESLVSKNIEDQVKELANKPGQTLTRKWNVQNEIFSNKELQEVNKELNSFKQSVDTVVANNSLWSSEKEREFGKESLAELLDELKLKDEPLHDKYYEINYGYDGEIKESNVTVLTEGHETIDFMKRNSQRYINFLKRINDKSVIVRSVKNASRDFDYYRATTLVWNLDTITKANQISKNVFLKSPKNAKWYVLKEELETEVPKQWNPGLTKKQKDEIHQDLKNKAKGIQKFVNDNGLEKQEDMLRQNYDEITGGAGAESYALPKIQKQIHELAKQADKPEKQLENQVKNLQEEKTTMEQQTEQQNNRPVVYAKNIEARELHNQSNEAVKEFIGNDPSKAIDLMNTALQYKVSIRNAALIEQAKTERGLKQEALKTYESWQKDNGLQIRKGQKGIAIIEPRKDEKGNIAMTKVNLFPTSATNVKKENVKAINEQHFKKVNRHLGYPTAKQYNKVAKYYHLPETAEKEKSIKDNAQNLINNYLDNRDNFKKNTDKASTQLESKLINYSLLHKLNPYGNKMNKLDKKTNEEVNAWTNKDGKHLNELDGKEQANVLSSAMRSYNKLTYSIERTMKEDKDRQVALQKAQRMERE